MYNVYFALAKLHTCHYGICINVWSPSSSSKCRKKNVLAALAEMQTRVVAQRYRKLRKIDASKLEQAEVQQISALKPFISAASSVKRWMAFPQRKKASTHPKNLYKDECWYGRNKDGSICTAMVIIASTITFVHRRKLVTNNNMNICILVCPKHSTDTNEILPSPASNCKLLNIWVTVRSSSFTLSTSVCKFLATAKTITQFPYQMASGHCLFRVKKLPRYSFLCIEYCIDIPKLFSYSFDWGFGFTYLYWNYL